MKKNKGAKKSRSLAFKVRKATLKDVPVLVRQRREMWRVLGERDPEELDRADKVYARWSRSRMKSGNLMGWVAEDRGKILGGGCVWLQPVQPRPGYSLMVQPYLLSMYTEPRSRGLGVASGIVEKALEWCRSNGFPQLRLHASVMGRKVYRKHGFERTWEMRRRIKKLREDS
ncbi:MAG TPA: GNAT family N-acetyltransferase [Candidatus Bathyarchaeia archaeon]|nr:GNAT family N-acetyltransferase [Candidatus Bathyarchaeia archaeon]